MAGTITKIALGALSAAVVRDTFSKPKEIAQEARAFADSLGKPLLNIGAGGRSLRTAVLGERLWGDVNIDAAALPGTPSHDVVVWANYYSLPWSAKHFGAIVAVAALETLERPDLALREWHRIADRVFVCIPSRWNPQSWMNRWIIDPEVRKAWPVWAQKNEVLLLRCPTPGSYARPECQTPTPPIALRPRPTSPPPSPSPSPQQSPPPEGTSSTESSRQISTLAVLSGFENEKP